MKNSVIEKISVSKLTAPLLQPFRTALGDHTSLENLLFALELADGTKGYGEAAIATHITGETIALTEKNLNAVGQQLIGKDISDYFSISAFLNEALPANKASVAAIEMAILDGLTRQLNIPLWRFFGDKPNKLISDITIVIADLEETESSAKKFYAQGFRAFKVKIGRDQDLDLKRVLAIKRIGKKSKIYLDANQGYSADETLRFLKTLARSGVRPDLVEQPVPRSDWEGLEKVTRASKVPICADESVKTVSDCLRVIKHRAADVINIKTMKSGFIAGREIAFLARRAGLGLMMGGMMETSLSMTASAHMAAGMSGFSFIDLDTPFFIKDGAEKNPYLNSRGQYDLAGSKQGIGILPKHIR